MKFSIKTYKLCKTENQFKHNNFLFLCNATTTNNNIKITQSLKKLDLQSYKLYKTLTKRVFNKSIYENHKFLINGLIMLVIPKTGVTPKTLTQLNEIVTIIGVKMNNKIYSVNQISSRISFKYESGNINLTKTLKFVLKNVKKFNIQT